MAKPKVSFFVTREGTAYTVNRKFNNRVCTEWSMSYSSPVVAFDVADKMNKAVSTPKQ